MKVLLIGSHIIPEYHRLFHANEVAGVKLVFVTKGSQA